MKKSKTFTADYVRWKKRQRNENPGNRSREKGRACMYDLNINKNIYLNKGKNAN